MKKHELKIWPEVYMPVLVGQKPFEVRQDDRNFRVGDALVLREWQPETQRYTGRELERTITHKTKGPKWGLPHNLCVLGLCK